MFESCLMPTQENNNIKLFLDTYDQFGDILSILTERDITQHIRVDSIFDGPIKYLNEYLGPLDKLCFYDTENIILETSYMMSSWYHVQVESRFFMNNSYGVFILQAPTRNILNNSNYPGDMEFLEAASETVKQTPNHNIKLGVIPDSNFLFVYTDKDLKLDTMCKIHLIKWSLVKDKISGYKPELADLYKAILDKDKEKYTEAAETLLNDEVFKDLGYRHIRSTFASIKENKIETCIANINDAREKIDYFRNSLSRSLITLNELNEKLEWLKNNNDTENVETLIRYIKKSPYIKNASARRGTHTITFTYEAPLLYYDDYLLEKVMDRKDGLDYDILKIFADDEYELIARCKIEFDTTDFSVNAHNSIGNSKTAMGHPHIDRYGCFGNHDMLIADTAENYDYLMAMEEITQAVLNLNFSDGIVINTMIDIIECNMNETWWRDKETGEMHSTHEILGR